MSSPTSTADREIVVMRVISAPRRMVFDAFTDHRHIGEWWGPAGFTTEVRSMDPSPGGLWRFTMTGPDGIAFPNRVVFHDLQSPERLVYEHGEDVRDDPARLHVTVTFTELAERMTEIELRSVFPSAEACEAVRRYGAVEGGKQTLARLDEYLLSRQT
jgi:uncharacterized protein YndB with AHSA1/START domain